MDISKDATNIIQSRQDYVLFLLSNYDFLDAFVQRIAENGQLVWFRVPFANSTVICMHLIPLIGNLDLGTLLPWQQRSAAGGKEITRRMAGLVDEDLYTQESEDYHRNLKGPVTSLTAVLLTTATTHSYPQSKMVSIILRLYSTSLRSQQVKFIQVAGSRSSQTVKQSMEIIETARRKSSTHRLYGRLSLLYVIHDHPRMNNDVRKSADDKTHCKQLA
ncbi:hypothetical protein EV424DRAFT_1356379 [Suillus variegatus]|nr:hypothetical protein EV424DRAFT_1356379 [Suillus variegatus]